MLNESVHTANILLQNTMLVGLLQNTAILLSLSLLYEAVWLKQVIQKPLIGKIVTGIVIGLIAMVLMKTPWTYVPGIIFDTRSVLLAISGLFFGGIPTIVAMLTAGAVRIYDGGAGMWMGLAVIIASGSIGILWQRFRPLKATRNQFKELLALGLTVHLVMLACTIFLPKHSSLQTFLLLIIPLLFFYTPATMVLGLLLIHQKKNHINRIAALKLLDSEQKFRNLFEHHSAVKLIIDPEDGHIVDANHAASDFYGWTRDELRSMKISNINTLPYEQLKEEMARVIQDSRIHFEFRHRCKDGRIIDVETFSSRIDMGGKTYLHSIIHDVSAKKQLMADLVTAKEVAEENDKLKTLFLMNMSHEIRTPLNGIMGFASILAEDPLEPEQTKDFAEIIKRSGQRLLTLINDMIDVSKIESGVEKIILEVVNAEGLLYEATQQFEAHANSKGLKLRMVFPAQHRDFLLNCDLRKLHQILTNLINNAIKFSDAGTIETGYVINQHDIIFYVKDQGIGIPAEYQDQVFNRFFQAHRQESSGNPGTGLGLTICKGLAALLGGHIELKSNPGEGTTFFVHLPLQPPIPLQSNM